MIGYRYLLWSAHRHATKILVPTEYVKDAVYKYHLFTRRKIVVTLEAGDPPMSVKEKRPENAPEKFILYVGSAFPHKNLERLVSAYNLLKETHADLKLVLVGKQEYHSKQLQKWAKRESLSDGIIFTGFVPDEELKWYYKNAEAYVFASLSEGFGLPGLEAMVNSCPVASSNATCIPEVLGDAAHYFDPEDVHDMATKIDELISNNKLAENLIEKGHRQAKKFSWERMAEQTLAVYKQIL
jgi:glycosyltransferase involved in cell wall biosynthesis